ncbi:hypothetical protein [Kineosporia babensis]|uniref:Uncharacterized protein n=1 Tax=Kineosporia babensis TaxID=499548 RepID=A0A9X1SSC7_9ACTN|nr:hypothetical protein [Kineosporia babensis]MCD5310449.1 hypothetical protein [Kineosporia babensis]
MFSPRSIPPGRRRLLGATSAGAAALLALTACGQGEPSVQTVVDATAGPVLTDPAGSGGSTGGAAGCMVGGTDIPADAAVAEAGDLDGDGQTDQIWLAIKGDKRLLGVRTASGASFSTSFTADQVEKASATAVANRLDDETAIILLATGYSAVLYAVVDCEIVPSLNVQGNQYKFDLGINGMGTGVACLKDGDDLYLAGFNSTPDDIDNSDQVIRTRIDLGENGTKATNGQITDLGNLDYDSPKYKNAYGVSCGDAETVLEPER